MSTRVSPHSQSTDSMHTGTITLALGVLLTTAVALSYPLSLSESFNPPDWVRFLVLMWLPIGFAGVPIGYVLAGHGPGRERARLGAVIALVGLLAFTVLVLVIG